MRFRSSFRRRVSHDRRTLIESLHTDLRRDDHLFDTVPALKPCYFQYTNISLSIRATIHDFTQGTGVKDAQPDPLHVTCHIKTAEWGQKKVHVYLEGYERLAKPVASVVFVKDHHTLGAGNKTGINPLDFRAFWHPNLSYGRLPSWLSATGASAENPGGKPSMKLDAKATWQYIDARAKEFPAAVEQTEKLPLKPLITSIVDGHMYTRFSQIVKKDFGAGQGQTQQMDYKTGKWYQMAQDSKTKRWSRVQPPPPGAGAGGSKK